MLASRLTKVTLCSALVIALASPGNGQDYRQEHLARLKKIADEYKVEIQTRLNKGVVVILPENGPVFEGFNEARDGFNRRIITPEGDPKFIHCMDTAKLSLGIEGLESLAGSATRYDIFAAGAAWLAKGHLAADACKLENQERIYDALKSAQENEQIEGIIIEMGAFRKELSGLHGQLSDIYAAMLAFRMEGKNDLQAALTEIAKKYITHDEVEQTVEAKLGQIRSEMTAYMQSIQEQEADAARIASLKSDILLTEQGLTSLVSIVLGDEPKLANRVIGTISGVSKLSQIAVALTGSVSPLQAAMLSFTALGVLNSMFNMGGQQTSATAILIDQIASLRHDVSQLRKELHERFSRIEQTLADMAIYMQKRFNVMEGKLNELKALLEKFEEKEEIRDRIEAAALTYLLASSVSISGQRCLEGEAGASLEIKDFGDCLADFKLYATDIARLDMITGSGRITNDPLGDAARELYFTVSSSQLLGYLRSFDLMAVESPLGVEPPSPLEWLRGVDAYLTLMARYDSLDKVKSAKAKSEIVKNEAPNIRAMIEGGEEIKSSVKFLRREGPIAALSLYGEEASQIAQAITAGVLADLQMRPLGVTKDHAWREGPWIEWVGGHSSVIRACVQLNRGIAGTAEEIASDKKITSKGVRCTGTYFTNRDNEADAMSHAKLTASDFPEDSFSMETVSSREEAIVELNAAYLDKVNVSKLAKVVLEFLPLSIGQSLGLDGPKKGIDRLAYLKHLMTQHVFVGAGDTDEPPTASLAEAILSLASSEHQIRIVLLDVKLSGDSKLADTLAPEINKLLIADRDRVARMIEAITPSASYPQIERAIAQLRNL